jgi:Uma2 family endonuclease
MALLENDRRYTYADYIQWGGSERWELIDGVPHLMAPSPSRAHQGTVRELLRQLANFLEGKPCRVYPAPFDVRLSAGDDTVVQPDLLVVCDASKLGSNSCKGAPDMIIEVLSPSTAKLDRLIKYRKYQEAGVKEYWIADPDAGTLQAGVLRSGAYLTRMYDKNDAAPVSVLPGCEIDLRKAFPEAGGAP